MSCKILYLESSYPINTRSQRIIDSLKKFKVHVCTWDRASSQQEDRENYSIYCSPKAGYGNKVLKLIFLIKYAIYFKSVLKKEKPEIIIVSHWDMLIISALFKRNEKLVYDNVDIPEFKLSFIEKLIVLFESLSLKKVDVTLLASRFYLPLYNNQKCIVLENLPVITNDTVIQRDVNKKTIKVGFVGSVRHFELLKNLMLAASQTENMELHVYGGGIANSKLKDFCSSNTLQNVFFHGKFDYKEISKIYTEIDILWAAYPYKSRNVKYAISNKFYESIYYTIPCLFSKNTKLGEYVQTKGIGVTVDPYCVEGIKESLADLLSNYEQLHSNLLDFKKTEDISWNKNELIIAELLDGLVKND